MDGRVTVGGKMISGKEMITSQVSLLILPNVMREKDLIFLPEPFD